MRTLKATLLAITISAAPVIATAMPINLPVPCSDSGVMNITGTYDEMTGAVNFALQTQDCKVRGYAITGTGSVKGTFKPSITDYTKFDTDLTTTMDAMYMKNTDHIHAVFNLTVKGVYDLANAKFDQNSFKYSIEGTGSTPARIMDLITIDWSALTD
ncbi:MAG: hypothetical protein ABWK15_04675 [Dissulfuribacterales bacterium]